MSKEIKEYITFRSGKSKNNLAVIHQVPPIDVGLVTDGRLDCNV